MHPVFLANEGTVAVGVMAVAMAVALILVFGLGAYVIYCDMQNRAGERALVPAAEGDGGHGTLVESHAVEPESPTEPAAPAARPRRSRPPKAS